MLEWAAQESSTEEALDNFKKYIATKAATRAEIADYRNAVWVCSARAVLTCCRSHKTSTATAPGRAHRVISSTSKTSYIQIVCSMLCHHVHRLHTTAYVGVQVSISLDSSSRVTVADMCLNIHKIKDIVEALPDAVITALEQLMSARARTPSQRKASSQRLELQLANAKSGQHRYSINDDTTPVKAVLKHCSSDCEIHFTMLCDGRPVHLLESLQHMAAEKPAAARGLESSPAIDPAAATAPAAAPLNKNSKRQQRQLQEAQQQEQQELAADKQSSPARLQRQPAAGASPSQAAATACQPCQSCACSITGGPESQAGCEAQVAVCW